MLDFPKTIYVVQEGDRISVSNPIEGKEGVFIKQLGRSAFGSFGEFRTDDGEIHIYDETVHTVKVLKEVKKKVTNVTLEEV